MDIVYVFRNTYIRRYMCYKPFFFELKMEKWSFANLANKMCLPLLGHRDLKANFFVEN